MSVPTLGGMDLPDCSRSTRSVPTEHSGTSQTKGKGAESNQVLIRPPRSRQLVTGRVLKRGLLRVLCEWDIRETWDGRLVRHYTTARWIRPGRLVAAQEVEPKAVPEVGWPHPIHLMGYLIAMAAVVVAHVFDGPVALGVALGLTPWASFMAAAGGAAKMEHRLRQDQTEDAGAPSASRDQAGQQ